MHLRSKLDVRKYLNPESCAQLLRTSYFSPSSSPLPLMGVATMLLYWGKIEALPERIVVELGEEEGAKSKWNCHSLAFLLQQRPVFARCSRIPDAAADMKLFPLWNNQIIKKAIHEESWTKHSVLRSIAISIGSRQSTIQLIPRV